MSKPNRDLVPAPEKFDAIRPYNDPEVQEAIQTLLKDREFRTMAKGLMGKIPFAILSRLTRGIDSKEKFQHRFIKKLVAFVIWKCTDGLSQSGLNELKEQNNLYITNHRDIVIDPAFLCILLARQHRRIIEIGIGDNLLIKPWIRTIVRLNKSFIVKRSLHASELLESSQLLSDYMRFVISEKQNPIWLAQREGRAKDSNDRTQKSVLKMLALSGEGSVCERLASLHLVPMALSYEYDPCDWLKAKEFQQKRDNPAFKKSKTDDLVNMKTGIFGYKGRVHFAATSRIDGEILSIDSNKPVNQILDEICSIVDREIFRSYRIYPCNYIALDMINGTDAHKEHYTGRDLKKFQKYLDGQLAKIDLENPDWDFLRKKMLEMYANPLINQLNYQNG